MRCGRCRKSPFWWLSVGVAGVPPQVLLVKKRSGGRLYAMKVLHKADIIKRNQLRHTLTERSVLQSVKHPFIVQMHYSFQSAHQLFLVRSYLAGGELFFHLRREGQLPEPRAQLYAAEILLALQARPTACVLRKNASTAATAQLPQRRTARGSSGPPSSAPLLCGLREEDARLRRARPCTGAARARHRLSRPQAREHPARCRGARL